MTGMRVVGADDEASILHADLDSFYASVEQRDDPSLRGRPVIVGGGGVVLAASYEAKAFGVRTPMNGRLARRMCPDAVVVPPRFDAYTQASREVFAVFHDTTPAVEGLSIDEAFLDVSGLRRLSGTPLEIGARLREQVLDRVGLPITVGIARTKFLAKVASGVAKPDGLLLVPPGGELEFLHPLPVGKLWGVGPVTEAKLADRGIHTVADVARLDEGALSAIAGLAAGRQLHALSRNVDPRRVDTARRRRSIGSQRAIGWGRHAYDDVETSLMAAVDRVTRRMRGADRVGRTITVRLRFRDFARITRSHTLDQATNDTAPIRAVARQLLVGERDRIDTDGCTLVGVSVSGLSDVAAVQLALTFERHDAPTLDAAVDAVRDKFGGGALRRGSMAGRDEGLSVPMLPD